MERDTTRQDAEKNARHFQSVFERLCRRRFLRQCRERLCAVEISPFWGLPRDV
ncbi:hypothetical protein HMPREF7215_2090 [Pyramidobacter piscolens W5455]|uniref:Uncharacterized protein n=1 Tax=Pyramidobacter piscolens W5455 TaxID=352165 RepID=A0ABM9ZU52_9BACT|nr:hypothetical protein HMPREF7215_2090 [Pyramidobacter piscolens W5455]